MAHEPEVDAGRRGASSPMRCSAASSGPLGATGCAGGSMHQALPIAHEIRHALQALLESGAQTAIDLSRLPLTSADHSRLRDWLGSGEVQAELNAAGRSAISETAVSGVWWVEHYGTAGELLGRYVEIAPIPTILKAQPQDMRDGLRRLTERLANDQATNDND